MHGQRRRTELDEGHRPGDKEQSAKWWRCVYRVWEGDRWHLGPEGFGRVVRLEALKTCSVADSWPQFCGLDQVCSLILLVPQHLAYCVPGPLGLLFARFDRKLSNLRYLSLEQVRFCLPVYP